MFELWSLQVWDQGAEWVNIYHSAVGLFPEGSRHLQGIKQLLNRGNTLLLNTGETSDVHTCCRALQQGIWHNTGFLCKHWKQQLTMEMFGDFLKLMCAVPQKGTNVIWLQYCNHDFPIEIIKVTKLEAGDARRLINELKGWERYWWWKENKEFILQTFPALFFWNNMGMKYTETKWYYKKLHI